MGEVVFVRQTLMCVSAEMLDSVVVSAHQMSESKPAVVLRDKLVSMYQMSKLMHHLDLRLTAKVDLRPPRHPPPPPRQMMVRRRKRRRRSKASKSNFRISAGKRKRTFHRSMPMWML